MDGYFSLIERGGHEALLLFSDPAAGLKAAVGIHSTARGPALGGTRMWPYPSEKEAIEDVLRLSRAMTYKAAGAELDLGGGKGVIMGDPRRDKSEKLLRAYGRFVQTLQGRFVTAEDMGIKESDLAVMRLETAYVIGGDDFHSPSPFTAYGVWQGIKACAAEVYGSSTLNGLVIAVQGVGGVGECLCQYLANDGAKLIVTDLDPARVQSMVELWGGRAVRPEEIYDQDCDIFAPCAGGSVINPETLGRLKCRIVAGAANNVLQDEAAGLALQQRGILYAPDYVINAGGLISVETHRRGTGDPAAIRQVIARIEGRLRTLFKRARDEQITPAAAADLIAEDWIRRGTAAPQSAGA
jgi:leucine dehydrogenase